jgi:precorrin-3B C17-methyltransferase / cobalt-factor III methyltransferase
VATVTGSLVVVGLGPGNEHQWTSEAQTAVSAADVLFGYGPYLDRVPHRAGQERLASDNREELKRAGQALAAACSGRNVAVVSGGDPGVFGMAAAICEALDQGPAEWRSVAIKVVPGISAMLAVAARVGAPLGHDFCAISLSNNLKPWPVIEQRLSAAATAGFVIALYNPISRARPWQLERAFAVLNGILPASTPVIFGRAVGRPDERVAITQLSVAHKSPADMATCIIVGSELTRTIERPDGGAPIIYTRRGTVKPSE